MADLNEQMRAELLPCPFCGSTDLRGPSPISIVRAPGYAYEVFRIDHNPHLGMKCDATVSGSTEVKAIAAWNRRQHGSAAPDALDMQTIRERDEYQETADKLAFAVAEHFGADIGEHSSANCPWANALDLLNTKPEFLKCAGSEHGSAAQAVAVEQARRTGYGEGVRRAAQLVEQAIDNDGRIALAARIRDLQSTAPPVADAEGVKGKRVKPWEVRLLENGNMGNESYFKDQEIAELRAALSRLNGEKK